MRLSTVIAMVAESAGVAQGTVILRVGSKSELAVAAFSNQIGSIMVKTASTLPGTSILEDLTTVGTTLYGWYDEHHHIAPALLREALFCEGPWALDYQQTVADTVALFTDILERYDHAIGNDAPSNSLLGEGILADYLLVLMYAIRGSIPTVESQVARFTQLAQTRLFTIN